MAHNYLQDAEKSLEEKDKWQKEQQRIAHEQQRKVIVGGQHKATDYVHPHLNTNTES